jgi:hypothetical protein
MTTLEHQTFTNNDLPPMDADDLDAVTGGCGACGVAGCGTGGQQAGRAPGAGFADQARQLLGTFGQTMGQGPGQGQGGR